MSEVRAIDANALREKVCGWFHPDPQESDDRDDIAASLCMEIDAAPTIDPVRRAWWVCDKGVSKCSGCGGEQHYNDWDELEFTPWCHNCGARMDAEEESDG